MIKDPRNLNLVTKSRRRFFSTWVMAGLRVAGKNMQSVLYFVVGEPTCMVRQNGMKMNRVLVCLRK